MYSQEKIDVALKVYHQCGSVTETIRLIGYPTRCALYTWIANEKDNKGMKKEQGSAKKTGVRDRPRNPAVDVKIDALRRCFMGESIKSVSEDIGYTRTSIYSWGKKYLEGGTAALMNEKDVKSSVSGENPVTALDIAQLQEQMRTMKTEIDILKETIDTLKNEKSYQLY